jgi:hypothetical protein
VSKSGGGPPGPGCRALTQPLSARRSYGYMPHHSRMTSEYLTAALLLGFEVGHCEELRPSACCPRIRQTSGHCAPGTPLRLPPPTTATRC